MKEHSMVSAAVLILILFAFFMSMHNLDNSWNLNNINHLYGTDMCDEALIGENCLGPGQLYEVSVLMLFFCFISVIFYSLIAQTKMRQIGYEEGLRDGDVKK